VDRFTREAASIMPKGPENTELGIGERFRGGFPGSRHRSYLSLDRQKYSSSPSEMHTMRVWFITGCSTGFGRLLAERVFAMGDAVVATARSPQSLRDIGREDESRILRLSLDVLKPDEIAKAAKAAIERFGAIDILVNNAGYGYFATQEEGELGEVRTMFETNVFGLIGVTQAVLPYMRERRRGAIINLSSIAGRITTPRGGFYQASKWAVEALSESLYLEVCGFGVRVIVIEPGSYETDFGPRSARLGHRENDPDSPYAEQRERWKANAAESIFVPRQNPAEVVDTIIDAADSTVPFARLPVGRDASSLIARRMEMGPAEFVEWMRGVLNKR
jgi:NADP-dependent 3-hydroxy acid dehydrogenase YdfG